MQKTFVLVCEGSLNSRKAAIEIGGIRLASYEVVAHGGNPSP